MYIYLYMCVYVYNYIKVKTGFFITCEWSVWESVLLLGLVLLEYTQFTIGIVALKEKEKKNYYSGLIQKQRLLHVFTSKECEISLLVLVVVATFTKKLIIGIWWE